MSAITTNAGINSVGSLKSIRTTGATIIVPTTTSAGPNACGGIAVTSGAKKSDAAKSIATTTAVSPLRPPTLTPAADSTYAPAVVVPTSAANVVASASAIIGRSMPGKLPAASSSPARSDTPTSVPIVSINAITKIVSSTPKKPHVSAALKSSFIMIGAGFGGIPRIEAGARATPVSKATIEVPRI